MINDVEVLLLLQEQGTYKHGLKIRRVLGSERQHHASSLTRSTSSSWFQNSFEKAKVHDMGVKLRPVLKLFPLRCIERQVISTFRTRPFAFPAQSPQYPPTSPVVSLSLRNLSTTRILCAERSAAVQAEEVKHDGSLDRKIGEAKELQKRTPWHREGADQPPVRRLRSASAITNGNCDV